MKKKTTETLHLHDVVQGMKTEEMKHAARMIGFTLPSPAKKDAIMRRLETALIQDADAVLDGLTVHELRLVCRMLNEGGSIRIPAYGEDTFSLCAMKLTGSKVVEDVEEGIELQVTLPAEMADAFQPIVAEMLSAKEHDGIEEVEQAAAGILAICGTMPFDELIRQLARLFPDKSEGWLRLNMKRKYLFKGQSPREAPRTPFAATPFLGDSAHQIFFLRSAGEQQEADRQIDKSEAMSMGTMPLPSLITPGAKELLQIYINVFGKAEGEWTLHQAWQHAQFNFPQSMIENILQEVCETEEDISDELVSTIRQFLSHIPRWSMYGYSLADRAKSEGVSKDKLAETLERECFQKGLEIVLNKKDI